MGTIPSYDPATLPLGDTDTFYIEQGSGVDRAKRTTIQDVLDKTSLEFGAIVNAQPTDSDGVVAGDFLGGMNGGIGKKIPVSAFEVAATRFTLPYTGAKSFRFNGSTSSGYGTYVDNLNVSGNNRPSVLVVEGTGRTEAYISFMFNPTLVFSSALPVVLAMEDITDTVSALFAGLIDAKSPDIGVSGPAALQLASGTFVWPCTIAADGSGMSISFKKANGTDLLYSDLYHVSTTLAHITVQMRIYT